MMSLPLVPLTITVSACAVAARRRACREVDVDLRDVGAGQVVDGDRCRRRRGR